MGEVIIIASGKGGVGKTTVTANLGAALARLGKKTVVLDADMGLRNLDIILGLENRIVYDALDVMEGACDIFTAVMPVEEFGDTLCLLPAPQTRSSQSVTQEKMKQLCERLSELFDYVLIDSPAGIDRNFFFAANAADQAVVVTEPFTAAVRDADRTIDLLEQNGVHNIRLVINRIDLHCIRSGMMMNIDKIYDILSIPLLGIIPYDETILMCAKDGKTIFTVPDALAAKAYHNIALRIVGHQVPITEFNSKLRFKEKIKQAFQILTSKE